jgi:5-methylcytosine-specific restriction endonuclease McrA
MPRVWLGIRALRRLPYSEYLRTAHWDRVRTLALERARHACGLCPTTEQLQVHHRSYARKGFEQPEDLVVLCEECHRRHHRKIALVSIRAMDHAPLKAPLVPASSIRWVMKRTG